LSVAERLQIWFVCEHFVKKWTKDYIKDRQYKLNDTQVFYPDPITEMKTLLFSISQFNDLDSNFTEELMTLTASLYFEQTQQLQKNIQLLNFREMLSNEHGAFLSILVNLVR